MPEWTIEWEQGFQDYLASKDADIFDEEYVDWCDMVDAQVEPEQPNDDWMVEDYNGMYEGEF